MQPVWGTGQSDCIQTMCRAQLEFVQILVIVLVMMVMVVVITCLLNHYRLTARSFISRHSQARRRHLPLASEGSVWPTDGLGPSSGVSEQQVYTPQPPERVPSYLQRERLARFQPTYPYLPHTIIDLPPTISLSDGEEPPPYQGPCTLQLRDPEQQMELNRESVRAPPNRTVFDSHLLHTSLCPPSLNAGVSAASYSNCQPQVEGAPPAYSEVVGHYFHPSLSRQQQTVRVSGPTAPPMLVQGILTRSPPDSTETRNIRNKEKHRPQQV
ncbi:protein TMEPAI isoform X2 [Chanos chanos]|uniref:Protein TMEPAI isoform X2 n=1 Tax=Chanos chanos TaxID=29144 RepID=A0A6J2VSU9_CHACN|nr:protein TMEPAI isoform X2 [Chanos chanos]